MRIACAFQRSVLRRYRSVAVATLLALIALPASAIEPPDENAEVREVAVEPHFETATVRARPLTRATSSVTVLPREEIEALEVASAAELIRFLPGLTLAGGSPRGGVAAGQVRGGDPNFTVVLLDGVPLNDATDQFGGSVNLNSLPAAHIERIELVRGPLSSFFGSSGLAGVVNLITRRGTAGDTVVSARLGGGNASQRQASASISGGGQRRDFFVGLSWDEEEGRVAADAFDQLALQGNLRADVGENGNLGVSGRYASWSGTDYPEGSGGPVYGNGETRRSDHDELSLGLTWQGVRHRVQTTLYRHDLTRTSPGVPFDVPPAVENTDYTAVGLTWSLPLLQTARTHFNVGAEVESEDGENRGTLELPPMFGGPTDASYAIDRTSLGAFVEWIAEGGPVILELGLRVDVPEGFDNELSPRLGIAYRLPNGSTRLRASAGRAFKLPSFFALASPAALGGNPNLAPEIALGADVGVEQRFDSADLTVSVTAFANRFEDLIDFNFASFMLENVNDVESKGVELALTWVPADDIQLLFSLTGQSVEDRRTGEPLRHRPDFSGGVRLMWRASERLRGAIDSQWSSEFIDQQIPVPLRGTVAGFSLYGASVAFDASPRFGVRARVDNLTDHDYETFIGFPGPGRSYRIALEHTWR